jgi:vancomycin permeability regulator SanA
VAAVGWLVAAGLGGLTGLSACVHLLTRSRIVRIEELPVLPVALVLGAEVYADGQPSRFLRARLDVAVDLFRRGLVEQILVSGDGRSRFYDETGGMRDYLLRAGIPEARLLVDPAGLDTYDSCLRARDEFGLRTLVVVSQSYHLPRALVICRALGLDAWGVGDESARSNPRTWAHGVRREFAANLKLVWDVASRRPARG